MDEWEEDRDSQRFDTDKAGGGRGREGSVAAAEQARHEVKRKGKAKQRQKRS